jgi:hypothetical protein
MLLLLGFVLDWGLLLLLLLLRLGWQCTRHCC